MSEKKFFIGCYWFLLNEWLLIFTFWQYYTIGMIDNLKKDVFCVNRRKKTVIKQKREINEALLSLNNV